MENRLREYIGGLFAGAPKTMKTLELKEEIIQNATEKYRDLLQEGKSPETAYRIVTQGLGDIRELINELEREDGMDYMDNDRQNAALLMAMGVVLYVLSLIPVILGIIYKWRSSLCILLFLVIVATGSGLLIYGLMTKPRAQRNRGGRRYSIGFRLSLSCVLWIVIIMIYLALSFLTWRWAITWMIFLVAIACEALISIYFYLTK